jgi:hypothetical protein
VILSLRNGLDLANFILRANERMKSIFKPIWDAMWIIGLFFVNSLTKTYALEGTGSVIRNLAIKQNSEDKLILEMSSFRPIKNSRDPRKRHEIEIAKAPAGGTQVPNFATELSSSLMNEDLKQRIDEEYMKKLRSYMYFHGYEQTSLDVRGRVMYNIDNDEELKVRKEMAISMRNYMLSRGVPKFLSSREETRRVGETYQKVVESTHASFQLSSPPKDQDAAPPWMLKMGIDPFRFQSYLRITNQLWSIETKYQHASGNKTREFDFHVAHTLKKRSYGSRYGYYAKQLVPYYTYNFTTNLSSTIDTVLPLQDRTKTILLMVTRVTMSYAF